MYMHIAVELRILRAAYVQGLYRWFCITYDTGTNNDAQHYLLCVDTNDTLNTDASDALIDLLQSLKVMNSLGNMWYSFDTKSYEFSMYKCR